MWFDSVNVASGAKGIAGVQEAAVEAVLFTAMCLRVSSNIRTVAVFVCLQFKTSAVTLWACLCTQP